MTSVQTCNSFEHSSLGAGGNLIFSLPGRNPFSGAFNILKSNQKVNFA